jgi:hypothetical protein
MDPKRHGIYAYALIDPLRFINEPSIPPEPDGRTADTVSGRKNVVLSPKRELANKDEIINKYWIVYFILLLAS